MCGDKVVGGSEAELPAQAVGSARVEVEGERDSSEKTEGIVGIMFSGAVGYWSRTIGPILSPLTAALKGVGIGIAKFVDMDVIVSGVAAERDTYVQMAAVIGGNGVCHAYISRKVLCGSNGGIVCSERVAIYAEQVIILPQGGVGCGGGSYRGGEVQAAGFGGSLRIR